MAYAAQLEIDVQFAPPDVARVIAAMAEALTACNVLLRRDGIVPELYESGVFYAYVPAVPERWRAASVVMREGAGAACAELAAWRAADLRVRGIPSTPVVTYTQQPGGILYHVQVSTPGGIEDPSILLGMEPAA